MKATIKSLKPLRESFLTAMGAYHQAQRDFSERTKGLNVHLLDPVPADIERLGDIVSNRHKEMDQARRQFSYDDEKTLENLLLKHHYIFTESNFKTSRNYGGGTYTLTVWKNEGIGKLRRVGTCQACTRAHKGKDHEAWSDVIMPDLPPALLKQIKAKHGSAHYIPQDIGFFGIKITEI